MFRRRMRVRARVKGTVNLKESCKTLHTVRSPAHPLIPHVLVLVQSGRVMFCTQFTYSKTLLKNFAVLSVRHIYVIPWLQIYLRKSTRESTGVINSCVFTVFLSEMRDWILLVHVRRTCSPFINMQVYKYLTRLSGVLTCVIIFFCIAWCFD